MEYSPRLLHQIRTDSNILLSQSPWLFSICNVTSEKQVHFIKLYYLKLSIISHFFVISSNYFRCLQFPGGERMETRMKYNTEFSNPLLRFSGFWFSRSNNKQLQNKNVTNYIKRAMKTLWKRV